MTLPDNLAKEVGGAWERSPTLFLIGLITLIGMVAAFWVAWTVVTWSLNVSETTLEKTEETQEQTLVLVSEANTALAEFEERQKLFRDWVRKQASDQAVNTEANASEFWAAHNALVDLVEVRTVAILDRLEEITERLEQRVPAYE